METQRFIHSAFHKQVKGLIKASGFSKLKQFENTVALFHKQNDTFVFDSIATSPCFIVFGRSDDFCKSLLSIAQQTIDAHMHDLDYFCVVYLALPRCNQCEKWIVYSTHSIFDEIKKLATNKLQIYLWVGNYWSSIYTTYKKTYNTYFVEKDIKTKMIAIVKKFKQSKEMYDQKGIPYKLSILLEGEPGTGKTSFVNVISLEETLNVYIVNTVDIALHLDVAISELNSQKHKLIIIVIEDIHKIPAAYYGQLFNLLDGIYNITNCIIVMTSNVPHEKLDKTLIRPGRVNYIFKLGYLSEAVKKEMLETLIPDSENKTQVIECIMKKTKDISMTPATLENWIQHNLLEETFFEHTEDLIKICKEQNYSWEKNDGSLYT